MTTIVGIHVYFVSNLKLRRLNNKQQKFTIQTHQFILRMALRLLKVILSIRRTGTIPRSGGRPSQSRLWVTGREHFAFRAGLVHRPQYESIPCAWWVYIINFRRTRINGFCNYSLNFTLIYSILLPHSYCRNATGIPLLVWVIFKTLLTIWIWLQIMALMNRSLWKIDLTTYRVITIDLDSTKLPSSKRTHPYCGITSLFNRKLI